MSEPERADDIGERVVAGMMKRCTDYRSTLAQIRACEQRRDGADAKGREVLDGVISRLRSHLARFPAPESTQHWQEGTER